jgi:molybdate transport system substrate-binding protein
MAEYPHSSRFATALRHINEGMNMRAIRSSVLAAVLLAIAGTATAQVKPAAAPAKPAATAPAAKPVAGKVAEIRVIAPGVISNAGLKELAEAYEKDTGTKVTIVGSGMGKIVSDIKTVEPALDVVFLPFELMSSLSLDGGVKPGTFIPLGRSEMGLAVPAGAPHPDISTVDKLVAVLKGAKAVMRSNPAGGSMVASTIENKVIKRPEFAGVNAPISTRGEGGQALARGEGDMAIQAICEILPYKEIELVGPLPRDLAAWIDMATGVSTRSTKADAAMAFIRYITRPEAKEIWTKKGLERF